jgi:hypothetical protein
MALAKICQEYSFNSTNKKNNALFAWLISQQYFSLRTNQPPATSQQYSSLRTNQHQPSATRQPNRLQMKDRIDFVSIFSFLWKFIVLYSHRLIDRENRQGAYFLNECMLYTILCF